jgi:myo-inositol-1(or 4)-monophosphatase
LLVAAGKAGEIALQYFRSDNKVWNKAGDSPVSEADFEVDTFLRQELLSVRPGYGWLSEETADNAERLARSQVFVVDPIDGTRGFLRGDPHWCISLAVVCEGRPVEAVLHCPALGRTFSATAGAGAALNGTKIAPEMTTDIRSLTGSRKLNEAIAAAYPGRFEILPFIPSLAYRIALVANGEIDGAFARSGAHEWDLAAADLILGEAGGSLTTISGAPISYNAPAIRAPALVIAGPGRHEALLDLAHSGGFLH